MTQPIAQSHDADPWKHRVTNLSWQAEGQWTRFMENGPKRAHPRTPTRAQESSKLWPSRISAPASNTTRGGRKTSPASTIMLKPMAQSVPSGPAEFKRPYRAHNNDIEQDQPHSAGQQEACERPSSPSFTPRRNADAPARKTKVGAQSE